MYVPLVPGGGCGFRPVRREEASFSLDAFGGFCFWLLSLFLIQFYPSLLSVALVLAPPNSSPLLA